MDDATNVNMHRCVLTDVPAVGFYGSKHLAQGRCPEDFSLPACLNALFSFVDRNSLGCTHVAEKPNRPLTGCGYAFFTGITGIGFSLNWNSHEWDPGTWSPFRTSNNATEPVRRSIAAIGYTCEILGNLTADPNGYFPTHVDNATLLRKLKESINTGRPVLGVGVVGPPEFCLITGYDNDGDTVMGWSFFQDSAEFNQDLGFEPSGYFRKENWVPQTMGIVILGGKTDVPSKSDVLRSGLQWGIHVMKQQTVHNRFASGNQAFSTWVEALLNDSEFTGNDVSTKLQTHSGEVGFLAEARHYAGMFLDEVATVFPAATVELQQAAGCFRAEHDLCWRIWECEKALPGALQNAPNPIAHFQQRETRLAMAELIKKAQAKDEKALHHLESAWLIISGTSPSATVAPARTLLEDVPYIGFDKERTEGKARYTAYVCAALQSALAYMGESYSYNFLTGVSGSAFRLCWNSERWDGGNISTLCMGADPTEHIRRAFRAVGWVPEFLGNRAWRAPSADLIAANVYVKPDYLGANLRYVDEQTMLHRIISDIRDKGYPVLGIGVVLPPEFGVITGFDQNGAVVTGWNHFQRWPENVQSGKVTFEPNGYFRKRDWYPDTLGLVCFDYKTSKPPLRNTYLRSLEWAIQLARTPKFRHFYSGLAAYDAWAEALLNDHVFQFDRPEAIGLQMMCHRDAISCIREGRANAAIFLRNMTPALPKAAKQLSAAAECYEQELAIVENLVAVMGGWAQTPETSQKLLNIATRQKLANLILQARQCECKAVEQMEQALQVVKG